MVQVARQVRQLRLTWLGNVGPFLQITWIARRYPVDEARIGTRHGKCRSRSGLGVREVRQECRHGIGELGEMDDVVAHLPNLVTGERLIVGDEEVITRHVHLGLGVIASNDGVIGTLEQQQLTVLDEFA